MTDVIEGMARAMWLSVNQHCTSDALGKWEEVSEVSKGYWRTSAQAALDYLKQPQTASKPTYESELARYNARSAPEGQGPEMTQEQTAALDRFKAIWQPICDVLRGDAP